MHTFSQSKSRPNPIGSILLELQDNISAGTTNSQSQSQALVTATGTCTLFILSKANSLWRAAGATSHQSQLGSWSLSEYVPWIVFTYELIKSSLREGLLQHSFRSTPSSHSAKDLAFNALWLDHYVRGLIGVTCVFC